MSQNVPKIFPDYVHTLGNIEEHFPFARRLYIISRLSPWFFSVFALFFVLFVPLVIFSEPPSPSDIPTIIGLYMGALALIGWTIYDIWLVYNFYWNTGIGIYERGMIVYLKRPIVDWGLDDIIEYYFKPSKASIQVWRWDDIKSVRKQEISAIYGMARHGLYTIENKEGKILKIDSAYVSKITRVGNIIEQKTSRSQNKM